MADSQLVISGDEKSYLLGLLESALRNDLVEEHRTDRLSYRKLVQQEIQLVENLLNKLRQSAI